MSIINQEILNKDNNYLEKELTKNLKVIKENENLIDSNNNTLILSLIK